MYDPGIAASAPIIDSGASYHMTGDRTALTDVKPCDEHHVHFADGRAVVGSEAGKLRVGAEDCELEDVVHVPTLSQPLLSVSELSKAGYKCDFTDTECVVYGKPIFRGRLRHGVYAVPHLQSGFAATEGAAGPAIAKNSLEDWHRRLGHLNYQAILDLERSRQVRNMRIDGPKKLPMFPCEICAMGKAHSRAAPRSSQRSQEERDAICHADLAGPFQRSIHGHHYYMAIKWRGFTHLYFLKDKSEAAKFFQDYLSIIKNRTGDDGRIKVLRTDNGGEFSSAAFDTLCSDAGIERQYSEPDVHYQNGVAERTNRTLADVARCLLLQANVPHHLWEYAIRAAAFMRNRVLSKSDPTATPYAKYFGSQPDFGDLHAFGESVVVLLKPSQRSTKFKFRPNGQRGIFVGHDHERKGHYIYVREGGARVIHSCDVTFLGLQAHAPTPGSQIDPLQTLEAIHRDETSSHSRPPASEFACGENETRAPMRGSSGDAVSTRPTEPNLTSRRRSLRIAQRNIGAALLVLGEIIEEPLTVEEAKQSAHWNLWENAIKDEIEALRANGTFTLVTPPANAHVIGSMINFRLKRHADGSIARARARVCAQGCGQIYLVDYVDTYAPVVKLTSIRVFLAECNHRGWRVRQGDVPTAYVKAGLSETIYVRQPKGFEEGEPGQVWLLGKALYGLKQAGREWNAELDAFLRAIGFVPTIADPCVYTNPDKMLIVLVYVDDILIGYENTKDMEELMTSLHDKYDIKDLGELSWFLGMRIHRDIERGEMTIDQEQYAAEMCHRFAMEECRPTKTPMDQGTILYKAAADDELAAHMPYRQAVGALLYLSRITRPDISYAVNQVSAHASNPSITHWNAVKRILRYVSATRATALQFKRDLAAPPLRLYTDADWANNLEDRKSVSGVLLQARNCAVHWECKRQRHTAKSSTVAEFIAADSGLEDLRWVVLFVKELTGVAFTEVPVMIDNTSTIARITNEKGSNAQKSIDVIYHSIKDAARAKEIVLHYCPTASMLADGFTKALGRTRFQEHFSAIGLIQRTQDNASRGSVGTRLVP